jgi:hypothetical protein
MYLTYSGLDRFATIRLGGIVEIPSHSFQALPVPQLQFFAAPRIFVSWKYLQVSWVVRDMLKSRWTWPFGLLATGLAGAGVVLLRGCWHRKMSWPIRVQDHSYQVCPGCGIKRLFDEQAFCAYGPYNYDLSGLLAWDREQKKGKSPEAMLAKERPA